MNIIQIDSVKSKIYTIRGKQVMLDRYLAELYGVETRRINEQVKRNIERFDDDFMFQLTNEEFEILKSHFATSSWGGVRKLPYAFINDLLKSAKKEVILIDNYIDDSVLTLFSKYKNLKYTIITKNISKQLKLDIEKHNSQYKNLEIKISNKFHDRFLILDDKAYHLGASLKDLGKKVFGFNKIDINLLKGLL